MPQPVRLCPRRPLCYSAGMGKRFEIGPREAALVLCAVVLAVLVYTQGWIWPLKAAAVMIPVSLLFS
jgi:hypothetical protein